MEILPLFLLLTHPVAGGFGHLLPLGHPAAAELVHFFPLVHPVAGGVVYPFPLVYSFVVVSARSAHDYAHPSPEN